MNWTRQSALNWIQDEIKAGRLKGDNILKAYRKAYKLPIGNDRGKPTVDGSFKTVEGKSHLKKECKYCNTEFTTYPGQDNVCSKCFVSRDDEILKTFDGTVPMDVGL